jgi:hypothetical protein
MIFHLFSLSNIINIIIFRKLHMTLNHRINKKLPFLFHYRYISRHFVVDVIWRLPVWNVKIRRYLTSCTLQFGSNLTKIIFHSKHFNYFIVLDGDSEIKMVISLAKLSFLFNSEITVFHRYQYDKIISLFRNCYFQ